MRPIDTHALYRRGDFYDIQHANMLEDIPFYLHLLKKTGGPVLELACGTGRLTIPIAEAGHDVTGLDVSETMLAQARKKNLDMPLSPVFVQGDARDFQLDRQFQLILLPFNSICHLLDRQSFEAMAACVHRHLAPDGCFVIDFFMPFFRYFIRDPEKRYPVSEFKGPDGETVILTESNRYDPATQINGITWYFDIDGKEEVATNNMRMYFPQELEALLHYNGFRIVGKYGNYDRCPFTADSPKQLIVASKQ